MDINSEMNELSIFWFSHPELWFNPTSNDDELITKKFSSLICNNPDIRSIIYRSNKDELL